MKIKRLLRLLITAYMIGLASTFPILTKREAINTHQIELLKEKESGPENKAINTLT